MSVVSEGDYKEIEKLVNKKITSKPQEFQRVFLSKEQALDMFQVERILQNILRSGIFEENHFKQEIIKNRISDGATITAYRCGPLIGIFF